MLIIGCGNLHRGDDAAGIMVAERLCGLGIKTEICVGGFSQLMEMWSGADEVIVIDAVMTGASTGTVQVWDGLHPISFGKPSGSTHGLGIAEAIDLARALGRLPARLHIYGIEGQRFEIGSAVSGEVECAVVDVVNRIVHEVKSDKGC